MKCAICGAETQLLVRAVPICVDCDKADPLAARKLIIKEIESARTGRQTCRPRRPNQTEPLDEAGEPRKPR